jgi:hypothetical protein
MNRRDVGHLRVVLVVMLLLQCTSAINSYERTKALESFVFAVVPFTIGVVAAFGIGQRKATTQAVDPKT